MPGRARTVANRAGTALTGAVRTGLKCYIDLHSRRLNHDREQLNDSPMMYVRHSEIAQRLHHRAGERDRRQTARPGPAGVNGAERINSLPERPRVATTQLGQTGRSSAGSDTEPSGKVDGRGPGGERALL